MMRMVEISPVYWNTLDVRRYEELRSEALIYKEKATLIGKVLLVHLALIALLMTTLFLLTLNMRGLMVSLVFDTGLFLVVLGTIESRIVTANSRLKELHEWYYGYHKQPIGVKDFREQYMT